MKIQIIDDHPLVAQALSSLIKKNYPEAFIDSANMALPENQFDPDLLISDLNFGGQIEGYQIIREAKKRNTELKIIVLSMHEDRIYIEQAMKLGASAYVVKSDPPEEIIAAIEQVLADGIYYSKSACEQMKRREKNTATTESLTLREREIAVLAANGLTSKEIGAKLNISARTVESHRLNGMRKLGVSNIAQLIKALEGELESF